MTPRVRYGDLIASEQRSSATTCGLSDRRETTNGVSVVYRSEKRIVSKNELTCRSSRNREKTMEKVHHGAVFENPTKTACYAVKINHPPLVPFESLSQPGFSRVSSFRDLAFSRREFCKTSVHTRKERKGKKKRNNPHNYEGEGSGSKKKSTVRTIRNHRYTYTYLQQASHGGYRRLEHGAGQDEIIA